MRYRPPRDLGVYARSQIEVLPAGELGGFTFAALVAAFLRMVNAHGDCEANGCQLCHEMAIALEIIEAFQTRIGPPPDGLTFPRPRVAPTGS